MTQQTYTVQRDDSLTKIAKRFGTTVKTLQALNDIGNPDLIVAGMVLRLPDSVDAAHPDFNKPVTSAGAVGPVTAQLPASGTGFVTYNPDQPPGSDRFGTAGFVQALIDLAGQWAQSENVPIAYGDMSRRNGVEFLPHRGHRTGREVDLRPLRKDGQNAPVRWDQLAQYDRNRTRKLMELIKRREANAQIFFNDPVLIDLGLAKPLGGHDNHLHLQIYD